MERAVLPPDIKKLIDEHPTIIDCYFSLPDADQGAVFIRTNKFKGSNPRIPWEPLEDIKVEVAHGIVVKAQAWDESSECLLIAKLTTDRRLPKMSEQLLLERISITGGESQIIASLISLWRDPELFELERSEFVDENDELFMGIQLGLIEMTNKSWLKFTNNI